MVSIEAIEENIKTNKQQTAKKSEIKHQKPCNYEKSGTLRVKQVDEGKYTDRQRKG